MIQEYYKSLLQQILKRGLSFNGIINSYCDTHAHTASNKLVEILEIFSNSQQAFVATI